MTPIGSWSFRTSRRILLPLLIMGSAVGIAPAAAGSGIDPGAAVRRSVDVQITAPGSYSATAKCPDGKRAIGGGTMTLMDDGSSLDTSDGTGRLLTQSVMTNKGKAWFGEIGWASSATGRILRVTVTCLPAAALQSASFVRKDIDVRFVDVNQVYDKQVSCPDGKRILSGGAYWHATGDGKPIKPAGGHLQGNGPMNSTTWWAVGLWQTAGALTTQLRVVLLCVPAAKLSNLSKRIATVEEQPGTTPSNVFKTLTCPSGTHLVVGGAWWILRGAGPVHGPFFTMGAGSPRPGQTTFYASGFEQLADHALRVAILCR